MKSRTLIHRWDYQPLCPCLFEAYFSTDQVAAYERVKARRKLPFNYPGQSPCAAGIHDGVCYMFFNLERLTPRVLAHEIQHTVINVMEYIGAPMCQETAEQMCYLHGALTETLTDYLRKSRRKL